MTDAEQDRFAGSAGMPRRPLWNPELRAALARARMTDAEKVRQPNNQTHLWCASCHGWWPNQGCPHHQDDAEKVREDYRWLRDVVTDGSLDRDQSYALALYDSILADLAELHEAADRNALLYYAAEERAEKAEEEREEWRKAFQGKQLYPISEMEQKLAREQGKREDAVARIQELEAATRHLFAELDRGYGAAEAFGRLRRVLLAGSEA